MQNTSSTPSSLVSPPFPGYTKNHTEKETNLAAILQAHAEARPDAAALIETIGGRERVTSFGELQQQVMRASALLWQAGLRPADEVLLLQPMSRDLYVALIALFRLGLVAMFIDPAQGLEHIESCCRLIPPKALLGSPKAHMLRLLSPALRRIPIKFVIGGQLPGAIGWSSASRLTPRQEIYATSPQTPALLTFTSGSTGQPKAALRTHGFLLAQHRILERNFGGKPGDVSLTTMPIFVLADLASGMTSLIAAGNLRKPGSIKPEPVIAQIERYHPVRAAASPAFWERITAACHSKGRQLPHLRHIYAGGAPVFPHLLDSLQAVVPQAEIVAVYGSTEAEPIAHIVQRDIRPEDRAAMFAGKGLLAGPPVPETKLRILRDQWGTALAPCTTAEFAQRCQPANTPGEIVVSGEHVLSGYVHGQGNEETKFRVYDQQSGEQTIWHRTGDMGYLDAAARLWLLGRCTARIEDQRGTLYPFAVECAVSSHPAVRRAAVAQVHGQRVLALELEPSTPSPKLAAIQQLVAWGEFDTVRVYDRLPVDKRHNAKIDYPALRELLERK